MSYDLHLLKLAQGEDPEAKFREYVEQQEKDAADLEGLVEYPLSESSRERMQSLANLLRSRYPEFEQFRPVQNLPWIELNQEDLQVQITVGEKTIDITTPYFRGRIAESVALIQGCLRIFQGEGFVAYDPQLGRLVDPEDAQSILTQYHSVDDNLSDISKTTSGLEDKKKHWWKFW